MAKNHRGRRDWLADWRAVRTGVITTIVVAVLGIAGGAALAADATARRVGGTLLVALGLGVVVWILLRSSRDRLRALEEGLEGETGVSTKVAALGRAEHILEHRVAELETREVLREYAGAPHADLSLDAHGVWGDAMRVLSGAIMSGWRITPGEPDRTLKGLRLHPPPGSGIAIVFVLLLPLDRERLDEAVSFLRAHGVPLEQVEVPATDSQD